MRKILLLTSFVTLAALVIGQRPVVKESLKYYEARAEVNANYDGSEVLEGVAAPYKSAALISEEDIGETFYDKQSNRAVANRIYCYPDGTMAATWTFGMNATGFDDRGTGYNYFDGNQWGDWPTLRIETERAGWPTYAPLGENGEIVVSHDASEALLINRRPERGMGDWTETIIQGPPGNEKITWPRVLTEGPDHNYVHILGQIRDYPASGDMLMGYYRSMDGGETWDLLNHEIEGTGHDYYTELGADSYTWAEEKNGVIAFFVANLWCDAFIMKSTDHGETWEKTIVWEHPYPFYNDETVFTDTLWAPDNSGHIALDSEGKAHVVFGLGFINKTESGTTFTHYPGYQDGIVYWNEDMEPFEHSEQHDALDPYDVLEEDVHLIGWSQDLDGNGTLDFTDDLISYSEIGLSTMPNIHVDENNQVFVVWASTTEGYDNGINNFKHIWGRWAVNPEWGWSEFRFVTDDLIHIFDECVYPQIATHSDDNIYMMYNIDPSPGCAVDDDHEYNQNKEVWAIINKDELIGIEDNKTFSVDQVSQNAPNPCSDRTVVKVELKNSATLGLSVYDLMGKEVILVPQRDAVSGSQLINIDVSSLSPGVYIYSVFANGEKVSRKLIVE
jgi:hypothetical protein